MLRAGQLFFGVADVFMPEHQDFCFGQTCSIDDGSMIQLVRDDEVVFSQHRRHCARISGEPGLKNHACLDVLEARDFLFQLHMNFHGTGDGAHRA